MDHTGGLIYGYLLDGKGGGRAIEWPEIETRDPNAGLLWMHMDSENAAISSWLADRSGLSPLTCQSLLEHETRPRNILTDEGLLLILRGVNCNPGADPEDMVAIRMLFTEHRIISMRYRRIMALQDVEQTLGTGKGPPGHRGVSGDDRRANRRPHGRCGGGSR